MKVQQVTDAAFGKYGRMLTGYDTSAMVEAMKHTPLPKDVIYVASAKELEALPIAKEFKNRAFGGMPIQLGYCNGNNKALNAVEYHRDSEVLVAATDLILMVGMLQDVQDDFTYDTSLIEAFEMEAGMVVELYATTLHYAPCTVQEGGFRSVIVLPKGSNTPLAFEPKKCGEDALITHCNKWLIAHPDAQIEGAFVGLVGENVTI